ncbi:hypothetical protein AMATHDRAFT_4963 [Amanita thiersii Skay4041]|uniref:Uncharacterized protein n=1 Tax=Amanita thiersii Skay4041 TaxID=703135 RepID=A0A2A9NNR0_9AGAR|nr:hypothetical protein AMATHDRAFT_4963 [Amanita thiersii Skay4041]
MHFFPIVVTALVLDRPSSANPWWQETEDALFFAGRRSFKVMALKRELWMRETLNIQGSRGKYPTPLITTRLFGVIEEANNSNIERIIRSYFDGRWTKNNKMEDNNLHRGREKYVLIAIRTIIKRRLKGIRGQPNRAGGQTQDVPEASGQKGTKSLHGNPDGRRPSRRQPK